MSGDKMVDSAEVGRVCDVQSASKRRVIGTAAENIGIGQAVELDPAVGHTYVYRGAQPVDPANPPKPPLCWICNKPLPHDCVGGTPTLVASAFDIYCTTVDATGYEMRTRHAFDAGWYAGKQAHKAQVFGMLGGYQAKIANDAQVLTNLPNINLELPDGDTREAKVRWSEWSADRKSLSVCISVTHGPPSNSEVAVVSIIQSWLDKQGHERCWYYPELFNQLAAALGLKTTAAPGLPSRQEFARGCDRYQAEQYRKTPTATKHGPPQSQQSQSANSFALTATPYRAHKWPIGTPAEPIVKDIPTWGNRLLAARAHRGLTLDALGARLTPPRTRKDISAMEHGRRGLSVELCAELAQALDCDRCWLAGWKEGS